MSQWEYDITTHSTNEILAARGAPAEVEEKPRVFYCNSDGYCFFDQAPNPYVEAIIGVLNKRGQEGWILVQVTLRERDMICFWRRKR